MLFAAAAAATVAGLAAGCHSGGSSHQASSTTTVTTTKTNPLWNPCAAIPDSLASAAGLQPATKVNHTFYDNEASCRWVGHYDNQYGDTFGVTVLADSQMTLDDIRSHYGYSGFQNVTAAGRTGMQFYQDEGKVPHGCSLAFPVKTGGLVTFLLVGEPQDAPPCDTATKVAATLMPALPPG
jgi:hypothetical protein